MKYIFKIQRNQKWIMVAMILISTLFASFSLQINSVAEENQSVENPPAETVITNLMVATKTIELRADANEKAEVIATFNEGDSIFVTGQTDDGWYTAFYQGKTGYFKNDVNNTSVKQNEDISNSEALVHEMEQNAVESIYLGEEVIQYGESKRRAIIWISIIGVAMAGIFVLALLMGKKKNMEAMTKSENDGKVSSEDKIEVIDLDEIVDENVDIEENATIEARSE